MDLTRTSGNILGSGRAEADGKILAHAFVPTPDFQALVVTTDFNFVVGRRGTGKSTLFQKVQERLGADDHVLLRAELVDEASAMGLRERVRRLVEDSSNRPLEVYRTVRAICRVAWKIQMLTVVLELLRERHLKRRLASDLKDLENYANRHAEVFATKGLTRCEDIIASAIRNIAAPQPASIPRIIVERYEVDGLITTVRSALAQMNGRAVLLFDGLDEGWAPEALSTALLGGLAIAAAELADKLTGVHAVLFIRDNMFRALAQFDSDASRHIEGSTLRLHWDADGLLGLVAARLRFALHLPDESPIATWNRFASRELKGAEGFRVCLRQTLYRPRDALVLLNEAFAAARRAGRDVIIGDDLEIAAKRISQGRLEDLLKEYDRVLPGLKLFVAIFNGGTARMRLADVVAQLDGAVAANDGVEPAAVDFALLGSGREIFSALQSVGFIGVYDQATGRYLFCHDGADSDIDFGAIDQRVAIHPCYWRALELKAIDDEDDESLVEIHDEYHPDGAGEVTDLRNKRFGQILGELPGIPLGEGGQRDFEQWVSTTLQVVFVGQLANIQLRPAELGAVPRDVVAINRATSRLWMRIAKDYRTRRLLIGVVNYSEVRATDIARIVSQPNEEFGQFRLLVTRSSSDGISTAERELVLSKWHNERCAVMIVGAPVLARCLAKQRKTMRPDYTEDTFTRLIDILRRSYLKQRTAPRYRRKKKRNG